MKCVKAQGMISSYLKKELSDRQLQEFVDHMQSCASCHDELNIYLAIDRTLQAGDDSREPDHYDFEKIADQELARSRHYLRARSMLRLVKIVLPLALVTAAVLLWRMFFFK